MAALKSQGSSISILDTTVSPNLFSVVPNCTNIQGPSGSATIIDATGLDATAKIKVMGLPDEGQVTLDLIWGGETSNAVQKSLRTSRAAQTLVTYKITLTDSPQTTYTFTAYCTGWALSTGVDDVTKASVTLEISGAVTAAP